MTPNPQLDEAFDVFQERLGTAAHLGLSTDESLASDEAAGVGAPLRALTIQHDGDALAILALTLPSVAVDKAGLIEYAARRARARQASSLVVCNVRDALLLPVPGRTGDVPDPLKRYPTLYQISPSGSHSLAETERIALGDLADQIAIDLATLQREGALDLVVPDADFFVERLTQAVHVLKPAVKQALETRLGVARDFGESLSGWAVRQGIPADLRSDDFREAVVRQAIYRLLGKVIFYQSLRRVTPQLPAMDVAGLDTAEVMPRLKACFEKAHRIDYHAVFREDIVDRLPYPAAASTELRELVEVLNTRDFAHLPQDVVGAVFERLIPPEDRHALGQYFTPELLVDLIVALCVRNADDAVLDPTCGTGTFLIRAYDRLRTRLGVHDHGRLLSQLWGVDIAPFPAELATINLFRQRAGDPGNFPRIVNDDFFHVVPGTTHRFPPLKEPEGDEEGIDQVDEPIPEFEAIVGNFPYIGAAQIERTVKGYRAVIAERLKEDWFKTYPEGFRFSRKSDEREHRMAREQGLPLNAYLEKASVGIDYNADLYVSLFWHSAAFLREGGRMGIVTSNAWLDVGYGYELQKFILNQFKIVAILESRCEPWFLEAAVNTVVTVVERCSDESERDAHAVRFVQVKRPLAEQIPWDLRLDALNRWNGLDRLVGKLMAAGDASEEAAAPACWEDKDFRTRSVRQDALRREVQEAGKTVKWGRYMRAPDVYFDLVRDVGDKLAMLGDVAPPTFGSKTGINAFFHFGDDKAEEWGIEPEFLFPLLKSPGGSDRIQIEEETLRLQVFICRLTKEELQKQGKSKALQYIEWGESQVFPSGQPWPEGAEVRDRRPGWYALPEYRSRPARVFFGKAYHDRYFLRYGSQDLIADQRLYFLSPVGSVDQEFLAAVMNCFMVAFFTEVAGRVTLGEGVLELAVEDARDYLQVPDLGQFGVAERKAIVAAFQPLLERPIGSVFAEVEQADRRLLDATVLRAMDLEPDEWLPRIYEGLTRLVRERVQLGRMRGEARRSRPRRAARRVTKGVLTDLLPDGPKRFPEDFLSPAARNGSFREVPIPDSALVQEKSSFGQVDLVTEDGQIVTVANPQEARFVRYAQVLGQDVARLPEAQIEVSRTVSNYKRYLRDLRQRLYDAYYTRTLDQALAERSVKQAWRKFGLPELEE